MKPTELPGAGDAITTHQSGAAGLGLVAWIVGLLLLLAAAAWWWHSTHADPAATAADAGAQGATATPAGAPPGKGRPDASARPLPVSAAPAAEGKLDVTLT